MTVRGWVVPYMVAYTPSLDSSGMRYKVFKRHEIASVRAQVKSSLSLSRKIVHAKACALV